MDMADLEEFLTSGTSVKEIASYLCRELEVEAKIVSLHIRCYACAKSAQWAPSGLLSCGES
jgi:hypothetical protein